jgi:hypothetical protein
MIQIIGVSILFLVISVHPEALSAQARGTQPAPGGQGTKAPGGTPAGQGTTTAPAGQGTKASGGQRATAPAGQRGAARTQPPMTLRQVIESLLSLRNTTRVEALVSRRGVQFQAGPGVLDILKEFGAGPKLLAMIPTPPPPPPPPPPPKVAGAFTILCEPVDCAVVVNELYKGMTSENRQTVNGLLVGDATVQVFADGFESVSRSVQLTEGMPLEEKFLLKRTDLVRRQGASASLLKTIAGLGGIDGIGELSDVEGTGTMQWIDADGATQEWAMTFNKRIGRDLVMTFRTREGQCTATILGQTARQECRSGLRNGGEKIAEQAGTLFLSYQLQDVLQALLKRPLLASEIDDTRLESSDGKDSYLLALGDNGLPSDLVYRIGDSNAPIQVQYSNYMSITSSRYPGRIAIGRLNSPPVWIFTVSTLRNRLSRER